MLKVSDLHGQAKTRLGEAPGNPKKLVLIHTAIALGGSLFLTVITYLLDHLIANTGGLGGLGTRSMLTTIDTVLTRVFSIALPFWQVGIFYAALQWISREQAIFGSLLQGFRRFGAVLGLLFLRGGLFFALGIPLSFISATIFLLTPFSGPYMEQLTSMMESNFTSEQLELMTPEVTAAMLQGVAPLLIIFGVLYLAVAIPLFYRIRFADFAVLDGLPAGRAMVKSFAITRKSCMQVWKVDLSFWWFYLLQILSVSLCNMGAFFPLLGISLPISDTVVALALYILGTVFQTVLLWQYEARRVTVYGLTYRTLDGTLDSDAVDTAA